MWKKTKSPRTNPVRGHVYSDWKDEIASDCHHRCVYCGLDESRAGRRNFCIDHYRPQSKFDALENDISNLYYSCAICNTFKGSDWPSDDALDPTQPGYYDPARVDYNQVFSISPSFEVHGACARSRYMIVRLYLNRPQLITARRYLSVRAREADVVSQVRHLVDVATPEQKSRMIRLLLELNEINRRFDKGIPYVSAEVKRARKGS